MSRPVAVLDQDAEYGQLVWCDRNRFLGLGSRSYASFPQLVYLADLAETYQLWVHPRWTRANQVNPETAWSLVPCEDQRQRVAIVFPGLDRRLATFAETRDGLELLGALLALQRELGTWFTRSPGSTAEVLIRGDLRRRGLHQVADLPEIATGRPREGPFAWVRPLEPEESRRPWLVAVDKHAAYLTAMGHLELGIGEPEHVYQPFDRRLPGYWHVRTRRDGRGLVPDPTRARGAPDRREDPEGWRWLTTPSVRALDELGRVECVGEAYVWRRHSRILAPLAQRLRAAREALERRNGALGASTAAAVVKRLYASQIGRLRMRRQSGPDPLYRPDWHDHLVAEARVNLWHNAWQVARSTGLYPAAAAIDCWYYPMERPEAPPGLRYGHGAGEYSVKAVVPLAEVRDLFTTRHVRLLADRVAQLAREAK